MIQCDDIPDILNLDTNLNSYSCACAPGSVWNQESLLCVRKCELVEYSTGINVNSAECEC